MSENVKRRSCECCVLERNSLHSTLVNDDLPSRHHLAAKALKFNFMILARFLFFFLLRRKREESLRFCNYIIQFSSHSHSIEAASCWLFSVFVTVGGGDEMKLKLSFLNPIKSYAITSMKFGPKHV